MSGPFGVREALDDLAREDASTIAVAAQRAWADGQRRRARKQLAAVGALALVAAVGVAAFVTVDGSPEAADPAGVLNDVVDEHPQRLEYIYWDDEQPDETGPIAGVVQRNGDEVSGWYSVSPEGHLWSLDVALDTVPAVSPDGTHLAYLTGAPDSASFVVVHQVTGAVMQFVNIGSGVGATTARYFHPGQQPSFWSPDGKAVLVRIGRTSRGRSPDPGAAVIEIDGSFSVVPDPAGRSGSAPVGWIDNRRAAFAGQTPGGRVRIWVVDVHDGQTVREFDLDPGTSDLDWTSQWFGSISGALLAAGTTSDSGVRYFRVDRPFEGEMSTLPQPAVVNAADTCPPSWSSEELYVPTVTSRDGASAILVRESGGTTVLADPRLDIVCSIWAASALDGPAHQSWGTRLFGEDDSWLSWHWREVALATTSVLVLLLTAASIVWVRRRVRP